MRAARRAQQSARVAHLLWEREMRAGRIQAAARLQRSAARTYAQARALVQQLVPRYSRGTSAGDHHMIPRYQPQFHALSAEQAQLIASSLSLLESDDETISGADLFERCAAAELSQAQVIMALAASPSVEACRAVETLMGRPIDIRRRGESAFDPVTGRLITPEGSSRPTGNGRSSAAQPRHDPRIVAEVAPNPKKPGTNAHLRYAFWTVGSTVSECLAAGLTSADVRHDESHGYVRLTLPGDPA